MNVNPRSSTSPWRIGLAAVLVTGLAAPMPLRGATADLEGQQVQAGANLPQGARGGPRSMRGPINVMVELSGAPAAQVYAAQTGGGSLAGSRGASTQQLAAAATKSQVAAIDASQRPIVTQATALGATILFRTQRVYNGIAMTIDASRLPELRRMPGVKAVRVMVPKEMDNSNSVPFIGAPAAWIKGLGYRGEGIKVGVIDTGIDYLHTNNGGPGTGYAANNTTVVGDVPNYPGTKVAGGRDFAGDAYNANVAGSVPVPDGDPMDCNGHGSHVAGTVGGYGVNSDGSTFTGPWGDGSPFSSMRIGPGVAPQAVLYGLRVFGCAGSTNLVTEALEWAMDPNGDGDFSDRLDVVNMSLGSSFGGPDDDSAVAAENAAAAGVIVVASAGNSGDTYFITGSPAVSARTISVASSKDAQITTDGLEVIAPPTIAGIKAAYEAAFGPDLAAYGDVTGDLQITSPADGCTALASLAGKIAFIDRGVCGFTVKVKNAQNAGAIAVVMVNNVAGPPIVMGGTDATITIPSVMIGQADGNDIKAQLALAVTVTVRMSADLRGQGKLTDIADDISSFSSRGPSRGGALKPDVSSIGDTVYSTKALSGGYGISFNGTSMAAPHVAGSMALLKQIHPTWSATELKALMMNSANHTVNLSAAPCSVAVPCVVGPGRAGAGRQDVDNAVDGNVVAYVNDGTGRITASFGSLDVTAAGSWAKTVTVANKGGSSASFNLAYVSQATAAGVTVTTSVPSITVAGASSATFVVTLTADPAALKHNRDASVASSQSTPFGTLARSWVTEEAGYVRLTPTSGGATLRIPVHAMPRPASIMSTTTTGFNISGGTGTANVTLSGSGVNTGAAYPTDVVSLVSAFELAETSPENVPGPGSDDTADLKYVGVMSAGTNLEFGIASYGDWSTSQPYDTEFDVYFDVNRDGTDDWVLFNWNLGNAGGALDAVDVMYTVACPLPSGGCTALNRLNMISPGSRDTVLYSTNVMVLGVPTAFLGISGPFDYYVASFNRENGLVDVSNLHTFDPTAPGLTVGSNVLANTSFWTDLDGQVIPVAYNLANYTANGSQGLLLLHHHNASGNRPQVVSVATTAVPPVVPAISITDVTITEGNAGSSNATFTVSLSETTTNTVTVQVDTADGTATAPSDYTAVSALIVTFDPGDTSKTVDVPVVGDFAREDTETFTVNLSNATAATIADGSGTGTILDGDFQRGDFGGDGKADILWYNTGTGNLVVWNMNGANRINALMTTPAGYAPSTGNRVAGVGDFNSDNTNDIVWQNANTGNLSIWLMNGTTRVSGSGTTPAGYIDRKVAAIADFDADGVADDILWRNPTTGALNIWYMDGTIRTSGAVTSPAGYAPATNWTLAGAADFNGDGVADILWRNSMNGQLFVWFMGPDGVRSSGSFVTPNGLANLGWKVDAIGDYNGDGKADLVYRNVSTGAVTIWFMDGVNRASSAATTPAGYAPATGYVIAGPR